MDPPDPWTYDATLGPIQLGEVTCVVPIEDKSTRGSCADLEGMCPDPPLGK